MREATVKWIQTAAHLAIIFTAGLICAVLIKNYLISVRVLWDRYS